MSKKVIVDKEGLITYHKYVKEEYMAEGGQAVNDMYAYRNELMANEQIRKDNEEVRKINEDNRANAEIERLSAEQTRDANEKLRIEHYNADVVAEKARVAKENERITAEQQRVINENARLGNEQIRVNQENRRLSNEDNRNTSENIRQANERARQTNDSKRTSDVKTKITEVTQITNECNSNVNQSIANINSCIDDLKGFKNEHNASIEVINNTNQKQNAKINNIVKKNKEQDIYINALLNEGKNKRITITEKSPELKLTGNSEGFVTVDKMVGDTLVNIHPSQSYGFIYDTSANEGLVTSSSGDNYVKAEFSSKLTSWSFIDLGLLNMSMIKPNTKYTIIFKKSIGVKFVKFDNPSATATISNESTPNNNMAVITTTDFINLGVDTTEILLYGEIDINTCLKIDVEDAIILEGDYTNKPIPSEYFEGIQSSFENEIVTQEMVDSGEEPEENLGKYRVDAKVKGKNLFNDDSITIKSQSWNDTLVKLDTILYKNIPINMYESIIVSMKCSNANVKPKIIAHYSLLQDSATSHGDAYSLVSREGAMEYNLGYYIPRKYNYVTITTGGYYPINEISPNEDVKFYNIQLEEGTQATPYEPYFSRTQTVYLNTPLHKGNEIVCIDGELKHYHKMGEVVLDKNTKVTHNGDVGNVSEYLIGEESTLYDNSSYTNLICDKFIVGQPTNNSQTMFLAGKIIRLRLITKDYPNSTAVVNYLSSNNVKVLFKLKEPYYETIDTNKILLETPNNATLSVDSIISPTTTVTYTTDIPDVYSLEETNIDQYDLIDVSLMATDEIYMMLEPILTTTYSVRKKEVNKNYAMINFYVKLVNRGLKDVNKVPEWLREDVIKELNK